MDSREIVILGAGKLGSHLARHLHFNGHRISMVWSRTAESAKGLAGELSAEAGHRIADLPRGADFYIMAVPDRVIPELAAKFAGYGGTWLHTAGAVGLEELQKSFSSFGVLYPLQTFSRGREVDFREIPVLIEGSSQAVSAEIRGLAESLSDRVEEVCTEKRMLIHLAAVFANNFSNQMILCAEDLLMEKGLEPSLLHPLLKETVHKIMETGAAGARTGPALRGDISTMEKHRDLLKGSPDLEKLYTFVSREIAETRDEKMSRKTDD